MITVRDTFISNNRHHCVSNRCDIWFTTNQPKSTIIVSSNTESRLAQFQVDAETDGTIYKDLSPIFKRYMTFDFDSTDLAWIPAPNSTAVFNVTANDTITTATTTIISAVTVENSWLFTKDWIDSIYKDNEYKICVVGTEHKIELLQNYVLHVNAYDNTPRYMEIKMFNSSNSNIGTYLMPGPTGYTTQRYMIDTGTFNLAQQFGAQIFNSGATYYTVTMKKSGGTVDSLVHRFNLDFRCNSETIRLHWMNSKGGFNAINLTTGVKEIRNNEKNTYTQKGYSLNAVTNRIKDRTVNRYSAFTSKSRQWTSTTDFLNESESAAFVEAIESPVTILELDNVFYSVTLDKKNEDKKTYLNNLLISYEVVINLQDDKTYTI